MFKQGSVAIHGILVSRLVVGSEKIQWPQKSSRCNQDVLRNQFIDTEVDRLMEGTWNNRMRNHEDLGACLDDMVLLCCLSMFIGTRLLAVIACHRMTPRVLLSHSGADILCKRLKL